MSWRNHATVDLLDGSLESSSDRKLETTETKQNITRTQILRLRWNYLARMWPESTVEMFVAAYPENSPLYEIWHDDAPKRRRTAHYLLPDTLPADTRFAILSGVRNMLQEKLRSLPDPERALEQKYNAVNDIDALGWCMQQFPCAESAAAFVESYEEDRAREKLDELGERIANGTVHDDLFERLARNENPELRSAALLAIRNHPVSHRVKFLDTLLNDADPAVRDEANRTDEELKALRTAPLQSRVGV